MQVLLTASPGILPAASIGISFISEAQTEEEDRYGDDDDDDRDRDEDEKEVIVDDLSLHLGALRALSWNLLDQFLDRQPHLRNVNIVFPDISDVNDVRRTIEPLGTERVNEVLQVSSSLSFEHIN